MKILVIGLDGASSELLFSDARLENLRRLMEYGCYGKLSYEDASDRLGLWMSLVAGQDVGLLGELETDELEAIQEKTIWNHMEEKNKSVIVVGPPPYISYPKEIKSQVDDSLLGMRDQGEKLTVQDADLLRQNTYAVSNKQFELVRSLIQSEKWDYLQFIDDGLYHLYRGEISQSGSDVQGLLADYYLLLDEGIGTILELIDDTTIVLVVSMHSTEAFDGSFILASSNNPLAGEEEGVNLLDMVPTLLELSGHKVPTAEQGKSLVAGKIKEAESDMDLSAEEEEILREQLSGLGYL